MLKGYAMSNRDMKELKKTARFIYSCRRCGICGNKYTGEVPYVCPVREDTPGFDQFYARGKIVIAQGLLEGTIEQTPDLIESLYACTLCGNCMTQCGAIDQDTGGPLVETTKIVEAMRADYFRNHPEWLDAAYHSMLKSTKQYGNPWGVPRTVKGQWAKRLKLRSAKTDPAPVLLYVGCTFAAHRELAARAVKAAAVLQKAGVDFAVLGRDEPCCGSVQRRVGARDDAEAMMQDNIALFNSLGCEEIVTLCAGCHHTIKKEYDDCGGELKPRVHHIVEFLDSLIKAGKLHFTKEVGLKAAYHDPCHLGRHMGIFDPPRNILRSIPGVELKERRATKENTICCGAGGGMRLFEGGGMATRIAARALEEAQQAGADAVVSACPFCEMNLDNASTGLKEPMAVYDLLDLVAESIETELPDS